jgi:Ca-activated chloride channel family protein
MSALQFPSEAAWGWLAAAAIGVTALSMLFTYLERRRRGRIEVFIEHRLAPRLVAGADARQRRPLHWLAILGCAFGALALLRPHWGQAHEATSKRSHDVLVLLDISESMLAQNPAPNRLERAKQKIAALTDRAFGDRFGLIAFSGAAELMCPLTLDHGYFRTVLNAVDTQSISLEGTDISAALTVATRAFQDQDASDTGAARDNRIVLLVSDGEAVEGDAISAAKELAKLAHIFVIGVGDPRGTTVEFTNRFVRGDTGPETHLSILDEQSLQAIAMEGAGGYMRSTPNNKDVDTVYGLIQNLFARGVESDVEDRLQNRYQWPLAASVVCFIAEGLWLVLLPWLGQRRTRREEAGEGAKYA